MTDVLTDFLYRIRCMIYREIRNEMIARTRDSFITRQSISEKLYREYDEFGLKLLENMTRSLQVVDLRFSLNRAKRCRLSRSDSSRKVAKEKTEERVSDETVRDERHRQE